MPFDTHSRKRVNNDDDNDNMVNSVVGHISDLLKTTILDSAFPHRAASVLILLKQKF